MNNEWKKSPGAQLIADYETHVRPAWLWDGEGIELIWRNDAARLFLATEKNGKLKLNKLAVPIAGQVRRLLRLGTIGLPSLSRVRFLVGGKPLSATCSCTPIILENSQAGLMIVAVDPVKKKLFKKLEQPNPNPGSIYDSKSKNGENQPETATKTKPALSEQKTSTNFSNVDKSGALSKLIKQLDKSNTIYEPLDSDEEINSKDLMHKNSKPESIFTPPTTDEDNIQVAPDLWRISGHGFEKIGTEPTDKQTLPPLHSDGQIGDFSANPVSLENSAKNSAESPENSGIQQTLNSDENNTDLDQVARYNFKKLGLILEGSVGDNNKNVSTDSVDSSEDLTENSKPESVISTPKNIKTIALSDEMLVLNRLPVGILIFKDQDILFANRALADMVGNSSISVLKANGLAAIFPRIEDQSSPIGPVLAIIDMDGNEVQVSARLQKINWHGTPALMLSAQKNSTNQDVFETAKTMVRSIAEARNEGFIEINRNGIISNLSQKAGQLLNRDPEAIVSKPFADFIRIEQRPALREFFEQEAKTAHTKLPRIELSSQNNQLEFEIFTSGNAGIVKEYFGTFKEKEKPVAPEQISKRDNKTSSILLNRLSRGIRRPLNTILGFSGLIGSESFGKIDNPRYVEYARDIETAGSEIERLTDEMDEFSRLEARDIPAQGGAFDLKELLEECISLVRNQASIRQVIVRSAISRQLPNILADRASIRQAILNLLASAIAQTPAGAKVVLSAQIEDDGSLGIHVRDSSSGPKGIDDRFVVFRERDERGEEAMVAMKSTMGLALTRSLISVNSCALHVDPSAGKGTLMSVVIPVELIK